MEDSCKTTYPSPSSAAFTRLSSASRQNTRTIWMRERGSGKKEKRRQKLMFLKFTGASCKVADTNHDGLIQYVASGEIYINPDHICGFYDHTILILGNKIRVMETTEQIRELLEDHGITTYK
jgi:hypothetical protein